MFRLRRLPHARGRPSGCARSSARPATKPRLRGRRPTCSACFDDPTVATPEEVKAVADLCVNCKMCRDECDARVNIPKLMLETKAAHQAEHGLDRADWFLARAEGFAAFGSNFAPIVNALLARRPVRWLMEKLFGLSRRRRLPAFALSQLLPPCTRPGLDSKVEGRKSKRAVNSADVPTLRRHDVPTPRVALLRRCLRRLQRSAHRRGDGRGAAAQRHRGVRPAAAGRVRHGRARGRRCRNGARGRGAERPRPRRPRRAKDTASSAPSRPRRSCSRRTTSTCSTTPTRRPSRRNTVELTTFLGELHDAGRLRTDFRRSTSRSATTSRAT